MARTVTAGKLLTGQGGPDDLPNPALNGHAREIFRHYQPRFYAADRLAQDILRGIDRNAALVIAPASARVAWYLWRYAPVVVNRMAARQPAWVRATFTSPPADLAGVNPSPPAQSPEGISRHDGARQGYPAKVPPGLQGPR